MAYGRHKDHSEVSKTVKYLLFFFNVLFWVSFSNFLTGMYFSGDYVMNTFGSKFIDECFERVQVEFKFNCANSNLSRTSKYI